MAGRASEAVTEGAKGAVGGTVSPETPLWQPKTEAEESSLRLRMEACLISGKDMSNPDRMLWAESIAKDYLDTAAKDNKLTGDVAKDMKKRGISVETSPYVPNSTWYDSDKQKFEKTTVKFEKACKADELSKLTIEMTPVPLGTEVSFTRQDRVKDKDGASKLEEQKISVNMRDGQPASTTMRWADGKSEKIELNKERQITSKEIEDPKNHTSGYIKYEGKHPRGSEVPTYQQFRKADGNTEVTHFSKGLPTEKILANSSGDRMLGYNAFDDKGNELSSWHPKSLSGRAYYESRELGGRIGQAAGDLKMDIEFWLLKQRMPRF